MKPEQQRIAIAKVCGFTDFFTPSKFELFGKHEPESMGRDYLDVPDYPSDLNAMHEAENLLTDAQSDRYISILDKMIVKPKRGICYYVAHATAAQRAEAFLRSLGLWEPDVAESINKQIRS
jgi:hypothetical protein